MATQSLYMSILSTISSPTLWIVRRRFWRKLSAVMVRRMLLYRPMQWMNWSSVISVSWRRTMMPLWPLRW